MFTIFPLSVKTGKIYVKHFFAILGSLLPDKPKEILHKWGFSSFATTAYRHAGCRESLSKVFIIDQKGRAAHSIYSKTQGV